MNVLRSCVLLLLLYLPLGEAMAQQAPGVGFRVITLVDPVSKGAMDAVVFYPSVQATTSPTPIGPFEIDAGAGAVPMPGRHPLVLISHGSGGNRWGHHDLAEQLARNGYIVAAIEHPGDNYHDQSGVGTDRVLLGRAPQLSALIDALLRDRQWSALIDPRKIGVAGFSAGGYSALLLAGGRPNFALLASYCHRHPSDAMFCHHAAPMISSLDRWGATADARVKAIFIMAPLSMIFDAHGLAPVTLPVLIYLASSDHILFPSENGFHIRPYLSHLVALKTIPRADHYLFMAPCSPALLATAREICTDPPGVDRVAWHVRIDADAVAFFNQVLGWGEPAEARPASL
ncbi:alpha/beta hydrolase family protein [Paludibacterium yongneupense]|uniref:alpha/beta hydrolase family protein n=1 Tax=Paludibacterium yongneupense TaxID=400061 RepID=UPI0004280CF2|nr:hypothetical protein [Paludibacterium yongneupense]